MQIKRKKCIFVEIFAKKVFYMFSFFKDIDREAVFEWLKRVLWNRYAIVVIGFLITVMFVGNHTVFYLHRKNREIKELQKELRDYKQQTEYYKQALKQLGDSEPSIERYAREHYFMHADNEDVYVIEE